jgi:predicted dehydrogenase
MNLALVGCGDWGRNILRDLTSLSCDVYVVDTNKSALVYARQQGAVWTDLTMENLPPVDAIVVAVPTSLHYKIVNEAARFGKPVFCEKPLTTNLAEARDLLARHGELIFVMDKWRYHSGVELVKQICKSDKYGKLLGLETKRMQPGSPHTDVDGIWILAPHDLSIADELFGYLPEPKSSLAYGERDNLTDLICVLGESPWCSLQISITNSHRSRLIRVYLEDAILQLPNAEVDYLEVLSARSALQGRSPEIERLQFSNDTQLKRELEAFLNYLDGGAPPPASAQKAVRAVEVIDTLRRMAIGYR